MGLRRRLAGQCGPGLALPWPPFSLPQAPCSALTWLRAPRRPPRVPWPRPLSQESQSSRGPGARLPLLQAWTSPWMEPIRTSLTQTWRPSPSSVCGRPPAPGTGASRWCVTHILCGAWVGWGPAWALPGPAGGGERARVVDLGSCWNTEVTPMRTWCLAHVSVLEFADCRGQSSGWLAQKVLRWGWMRCLLQCWESWVSPGLRASEEEALGPTGGGLMVLGAHQAGQSPC